MYVRADGERVRELLGDRTAREVVREAGITPETLRRVERNRGPIMVETARGIGRALGVDPRSFARAISTRPSERA